MKTAHTHLQTNASRLGLSKSPSDYDIYAQFVDLMGTSKGSEIGIAFFVAMVGALLDKPVQESLVILGEMSLHGGLQPMSALTERLQLAMDNGAKRVLLPVENKRDLVDVPGDVLGKLQIIFFSDPVNAAFRAMGLE
jgi:ATP-dependent Lon protease